MGADSEQGKKLLRLMRKHNYPCPQDDRPNLHLVDGYLDIEAIVSEFQAGVESGKEKIQFIFNLLETYGSIGECPYEASSDLEKQIKTYHCYGCDAEGYSSWPDWKVEFTHEPNCKWVDVASLSLQGRKQEK